MKIRTAPYHTTHTTGATPTGSGALSQFGPLPSGYALPYVGILSVAQRQWRAYETEEAQWCCVAARNTSFGAQAESVILSGGVFGTGTLTVGGQYHDGTDTFSTGQDVELAEVTQVTVRRGDNSAEVTLSVSWDPVFQTGTLVNPIGLLGGLSRERGDQILSIPGLTPNPAFWWTRNDADRTRFGIRDGRNLPLRGTTQVSLGARTPTVSLNPAPEVSVGSILNSRYLRVGSEMIGPGMGGFDGVLCVSDVDSYVFTTDLHGVCDTEGYLRWNPDFIPESDVWYAVGVFDQDGVVGSPAEDLWLAPIPVGLEHPLIRIGNSPILLPVAAEDDNALAALNLAINQVGFSRQTGKLRFHAEWAERVRSSYEWYDAEVQYEGVTLSPLPVGGWLPTILVDSSASPATAQSDLFVPDAVTTATEQYSGVLLVPDGSGRLPSNGVPTTRPNLTGLVRSFPIPPLIFGDGYTPEVRVVRLESEVPNNIPPNVCYVSLEEDVAGSRLWLNPIDRARVGAQYLYVVYPAVPFGYLQEDLMVLGRDLWGGLTLTDPLSIPLSVEGSPHTWTLSPGYHSLQDLLSSLEILLGDPALVGQTHGYIRILSDDVEVSEGVGHHTVGLGPFWVSGFCADRGLSLVYREGVVAPTIRSTGFVEGSVGVVGPQTTTLLTTVPMQGIDGFGPGEWFSSAGRYLAQNREVEVSPRRYLRFLKEVTQTYVANERTIRLSVPFGANPPSLLLGDGVQVSLGGSPLQSPDRYTVGDSVVALRKMGSEIARGYAGQFNGSTFTDPNVGSYPGVSAGDLLCAIDQVFEIAQVSGNTITIEGAAQYSGFTWEIIGSDGVIAKGGFGTHDPTPYFVVTVSRYAGTVLSPEVLTFTPEGVTVGGEARTLEVLATESIGTLSEYLTVSQEWAADSAFGIRIGSLVLEVGAGLVLSPDLNTAPPSQTIHFTATGELRVAADLLTEYDLAEVWAVERLGDRVVPTGQVWYAPDVGILSLNPSEDPTAEIRIIRTEQPTPDPLVGSFRLTEPLTSGERVSVAYQNPQGSVVKNLTFRKRRQPTIVVRENVWSFGSTEQAIQEDPAPIAYLNGIKVASRFSLSTKQVSLASPSTGTLMVDYSVLEAQGGEVSLSVGERVVVPSLYLAAQTTTLNLPTADIPQAGSLVRLGGSIVEVESVAGSTLAIAQPLPLDAGSLESTASLSVRWTDGAVDLVPLPDSLAPTLRQTLLEFPESVDLFVGQVLCQDGKYWYEVVSGSVSEYTLSQPIRSESTAWEAVPYRLPLAGDTVLSNLGLLWVGLPFRVFRKRGGSWSEINPEVDRDGRIILTDPWEVGDEVRTQGYSPLVLNPGDRYRVRYSAEGISTDLLGETLLARYRYWAPDTAALRYEEAAGVSLEPEISIQPLPYLAVQTSQTQRDSESGALSDDLVAALRISDLQELVGGHEQYARDVGLPAPDQTLECFVPPGSDYGQADSWTSALTPRNRYVDAFLRESLVPMIEQDPLLNPIGSFVIGDELFGTPISATELATLQDQQTEGNDTDDRVLIGLKGTKGRYVPIHNPSSISILYPTQQSAEGSFVSPSTEGDLITTLENQYGELVSGAVTRMTTRYPTNAMLRIVPPGFDSLPSYALVASPVPQLFPWGANGVEYSLLLSQGGDIPDLSDITDLSYPLGVVRDGVRYRLMSSGGSYDSEGRLVLSAVYADSIAFGYAVILIAGSQNPTPDQLFLSTDGVTGIPFEVLEGDLLTQVPQELPQGDAPDPETPAWRNLIRSADPDLLPDVTIVGSEVSCGGSDREIVGQYRAEIAAGNRADLPTEDSFWTGEPGLTTQSNEADLLVGALQNLAVARVDTPEEIPSLFYISNGVSDRTATLVCDDNLTPSIDTGVYPLNAGSLLLNEVDGRNVGWQGWQEVAAVGSAGLGTFVRTPRFVSRTAIGGRLRYLFENAVFVSNVTISEVAPNTLIDFSATSVVLNDGSLFATGGFNDLVDSLSAPYPNQNLIRLRFYDNSGTVLESVEIQGDQVFGFVGSGTLGSTPLFQSKLLTLERLGFATPSTYAYCAISVDTTLEGSYKGYIDSDRLTFRESYDLSTAPLRGFSVGSTGLQAELSVVACEGAAGNTLTHNSPSVVNGGSPFTFPATIETWRGFSAGSGFVRVPSWEGFQNTPISLPSERFRAIPLEPQAVGEGSAIENIITPTSWLSGGYQDVQPGDFVVVSDDTSGGATVKAGIYPIRHVVEESGNPGTYQVHLISTAGSGNGWARVRYPVALDYAAGTLTVDVVPTVRDLDGSDVSAFSAAGYVYLVRDLGALRDSGDLSRVDSAVYRATYTGRTASTFTGLSGWIDADGNPISEEDFQAAVLTEQCLVAGHRYVGIEWEGVPGLPDYQVVASDYPGTVLGFSNIRFSHPNASTLDFTASDLSTGSTVSNKLRIDPADKVLDVGQCPDLDDPLYQNIPRLITLTGVGSAQWASLYGIAKVGYETLLPGTLIESTDGSGPTFHALAGLFCEPSFPTPISDLAASPAHVSDVAHQSAVVGMRDPSDYGGAAGAEPVTFAIRRSRRFALQTAGSSLRSIGDLWVQPSGVVLTHTQGFYLDTLLIQTTEGLGTGWVRVGSRWLWCLSAQGQTLTIRSVGEDLTGQTIWFRDGSLETVSERWLSTAFETVLRSEPTLVSDQGGYCDQTNELSDTEIPDFGMAGVMVGDFVLIDPAGPLNLADERGSGPHGSELVPGRVGYVPGTVSLFDDNRGFYRVAEVNGSTLVLDPVHAFAGSESDPVLFGEVPYQYAMYPVVDQEGQNDLRVTQMVSGGSFALSTDSVAPFGYRILRSKGLVSDSLCEVLLADHVLTKDLIDTFGYWLTREWGSYRAFQAEVWSEDLNPLRGDPAPSNEALDRAYGLSQEIPYGSGPSMSTLLGAAVWHDCRILRWYPSLGSAYGDNLEAGLWGRMSAEMQEIREVRNAWLRYRFTLGSGSATRQPIRFPSMDQLRRKGIR